MKAPRRTLARLTAALLLGSATSGRADESGVSFWQPGAYDSLSAIPNSPGWALATQSIHNPSFAGESVSAARLVRTGALTQTQGADLIGASDSFTNIMIVNPSYAFSEQLLGAQATFSLSTMVGKSTVYDHGSLSAASGARTGDVFLAFGDSAAGFGDLAPQLTLFWADGNHHFMTYGTTNLPVGNYRNTRLANLGIGHGALDGGGGYTYLDHKAGIEISGVAGLTYNFSNPITNYKSGADFHLDAGASKYLTDALFAGPVAYVYREVGCDGGMGDKLGCFRSQVAAAGAEVGCSTTVEKTQAYFNLKGYREFAAENRSAGWSLWLTVTLSPK